MRDPVERRLPSAHATARFQRVDRQTGQVVSEFPRETVLNLRSDPKYARGSVIDTKA